MRPWAWCSNRSISRRRRQPRSIRRIESLESRQLLTLTIEIDYSHDTNNFFSDPIRREVMELAASTIADRLHDQLLEVAPSGSNTWSISFTHPGTGDNATIDNPTIPADTLRIFVGGRDLGVLGFGGPGGWDASGSDAWFETIDARGQFGVLENPASDFAPWGGSITFDSDNSWYFGASLDGWGGDEDDFLSVAMHELGHVLGVGTTESWHRWVVGGQFTGPNVQAERDGSPGPVPLNDDAHFEEDFEESGEEVAMDPRIMTGTRKLFTAMDFAGLKDIGWEVGELPPDVEDPPLPATQTITVTPGVAHRIVIQDDSDPSNGRSKVTIDGQSSNFVNPTDELIIHGGSKNDVITIQSLDPAFAAKITVFAGGGHDRVDASRVSARIHAIGSVGKDTMIGGSGHDTLVGGADPDVLTGPGGRDELYGDAGNDLLNGGTENDTVFGGVGDDKVYGNFGDDTLQGDLGNDLLYGGPGLDSALGGGGHDQLFGEAGNDTLRGELGNDLLYGGLDNDSLWGGVGIDKLFGEAGEDILNGGANNDFLYGGAGHDGLSGFTGDDYLQGDAGNDTLIGGAGNDNLRGGFGNDVLLGKSGKDLVIGDQNTDTIAGGSGSGRDVGDVVKPAVGELVNEAFVFNADWIDDV